MATAGIQLGAAVLKLGMGLLAAHDLRYKDALNENAAVVQAVGVFDNDLQAIFAALNAGQVTEQEAIQYLQQTSQQYWKYVGQYAGKPGVASRPCGPLQGGPVGHGACAKGPLCDKTCTAGCCVGCNDIEAAIANAIATIQAGGGTFGVCEVFPNDKYKNSGRPGYQITYVRPDIATGTAGAVDGFLNSLGLGAFTSPGASQYPNPLGQGGTPQGSVGLTPGPTLQKYAAYGLLAIAGLFVAKRIL